MTTRIQTSLNRLGGETVVDYNGDCTFDVSSIADTFPGKSIIHSDKHISIQLSEYKNVVDWFESQALYRLVLLPDNLYDFISRARSKPDYTRFEGIQVYHHLRDYQKKLLWDLLCLGGRGFNLSEMGTGKTIVAIGFIEYYGTDNVLVVCPSSTRQNMVNEIRRFTSHEVTLIKTTRTPLSNGINVISFDMVRALPKRKVWNTIIVDESHYVKNLAAKRTKALLQISKTAGHMLLMSGTPLSKPVELYSQLKSLYPSVFRLFSQFTRFSKKPTDVATPYFFGDRYCKPTRVYVGKGSHIMYEYKGSERLTELNAILKSVSIRCKKADVLHLPPKHRRTRYVNSLDFKTSRSQLERIEILRKGVGQMVANREVSKLVREHSACKLPFVLAYIKNLVNEHILKNSREKHILFAHHLSYIHACAEVLTEMDMDFIQIHGGTPANVRQTYIDTFNTDKKTSFAILSIQACGVGLNITGASNVIFLELSWSDKSIIQAEDRAHRSGQEHPVYVTYLMTRNSMDDIMLQCVIKKQSQTGLVLDHVPNRLDIIHSSGR